MKLANFSTTVSTSMKNLIDLIKTDMIRALLEKPFHTVGVTAGIACVSIGHSFVSGHFELRKEKTLSVIRMDEEKTLSFIRTDELKRKKDEECKGFMRKIPWPIRLLY